MNDVQRGGLLVAALVMALSLSSVAVLSAATLAQVLLALGLIWSVALILLCFLVGDADDR